MKTYEKFRKWITIAVLVFMLVGVGALAQVSVRAEEPEGKHLVISVVEDLEAIDIEDYPVPLGAFPDTPNSSGNRHIAMMAGLLLLVCVYAGLRIRQEKRLVMLKKEAARAEYRMMSERRAGHEGSHE